MGFLFYTKLYLLTIPIFFLIDIVWLGYVAKGFYRKNLAFVLSPEVNWSAAVGLLTPQPRQERDHTMHRQRRIQLSQKVHLVHF